MPVHERNNRRLILKLPDAAADVSNVRLNGTLELSAEGLALRDRCMGSVGALVAELSKLAARKKRAHNRTTGLAVNTTGGSTNDDVEWKLRPAQAALLRQKREPPLKARLMVSRVRSPYSEGSRLGGLLLRGVMVDCGS